MAICHKQEVLNGQYMSNILNEKADYLYLKIALIMKLF